MTELRGVYSILATPFHQVGELDLEALGHLAEWTLNRGAHGLVTLAIASEVYKLTDPERRLVMQTVIERVAGRVPVVVGCGHPGSTLGTIAYLREAEVAGAAAAMVAPPFVSRPGPDDVVEFYREASAATSLPIVLQDEPVTTGLQLPAALIARVAREVPGVRYAKVEAPPTPRKFSEIASLVGDERLGLFGAVNGLYWYEELGRGARGVMTSFPYPEVLAAIWELWQTGDRLAAADLFYRWLPLIRLGAQPGVGLALLKETLLRRGAIPCSSLRRPAASADPATLRDLEGLLARLEPTLG